jgi:hypothetical protein
VKKKYFIQKIFFIQVFFEEKFRESRKVLNIATIHEITSVVRPPQSLRTSHFFTLFLAAL